MLNLNKKEHTKKISNNLFLCWSSTPEYEIYPRMPLIYQVLLYWEEKIFFCLRRYQLKRSSWLSVGLCAYSLSGMLFGLDWYGPFACCDNPCVFTCAWALLCLEDAISLESSTTSGSCSLFTSSFPQMPEPWGEKFHKDIIPSGSRDLRSFTIWTVSTCGHVVHTICIFL